MGQAAEHQREARSIADHRRQDAREDGLRDVARDLVSAVLEVIVGPSLAVRGRRLLLC
jgi:hypothetical protein